MELPFSAPIVGARFRPPAADVLNNLGADTELVCVREPGNPHDENAIQVCILEADLPETITGDPEIADQMEFFGKDEDESLFHLGYVPREKAEVLAPLIDKMGGRCPGKLAFTMEGRPQVDMKIIDD